MARYWINDRWLVDVTPYWIVYILEEFEEHYNGKV